MAHPVTWFQIGGKNGKRLQTFYKQVFGWKMTQGPGGMAMIAPEPQGIAGGIAPTTDGNPSVAVYVNTDDIHAQLARAEKAGGKKAMDPMPLPNDMGTIAGFLDPAGNWIGLWAPGRGVSSGAQATRGKSARRSAGKAARVAKKARGRARKA